MADERCTCTRCGRAGAMASCSIRALDDSRATFRLCAACLASFVGWLDRGQAGARGP